MTWSSIAAIAMLWCFGSILLALVVGRWFRACDPQRMEPRPGSFVEWEDDMLEHFVRLGFERSKFEARAEHRDRLAAIEAGGPLDPDTMEQIIAHGERIATASGEQAN